MLRLKTRRVSKQDIEGIVKNILAEMVNQVAWKDEEEKQRMEARCKYFRRLAKVPNYAHMLQNALERICHAASPNKIPPKRLILMAKILLRLEIDLEMRPDPFAEINVDSIIVAS